MQKKVQKAVRDRYRTKQKKTNCEKTLTRPDHLMKPLLYNTQTELARVEKVEQYESAVK